MNLQNIRYALEVSRTGSINQAAENLYMNQPNLSKAIKELEKELGYRIFNRTTKGITPTQKGEIFLLRGKKVLFDVKELEELFRWEESPLRISVVVPKYFPLSQVLNSMKNQISYNEMSSWDVIEMDNDKAIQRILEGQSNLGILRYPSMHDLYVCQYLQSKGIESKLLSQNSRMLVFSVNSSLAKELPPPQGQLINKTEIQLYAEPSRFLPEDSNTAKPYRDSEGRKGPLFLFSDISSALEMLSHDPNTYMVAPSPLPTIALERYQLGQSVHWDDSLQYVNRLIYGRNHSVSDIEQVFIKEVMKSLETGVQVL